jgi:hypothetical protein
MSRLFGREHRQFQDMFDTRRIADRIEEIGVRNEVGELEKAFIESRDMFFLATADREGRPTVSYKGGETGFVQVVDARTLIFPSYDGNGMYLSMGNIVQNAHIGMLFIDFERPHRLRVQGTATVTRDEGLLSRYHEADLVVRVTVNEMFPNCPRYVHRYQKVAQSHYVPHPECETPIAGWKRVDLIQDALPERDVAKARSASRITLDEWFAKVQAGDPEA